MTTYRERREARAERLRGWADKREAKSSAELARSHELLDPIPFGQPILVGHHSERADRRRRDAAWDALGRSAENAKTAERMSSSADTIEAQADRAIYRDDPDALERLRERIAELEAKRERIKRYNASARKTAPEKPGDLSILTELEREDLLHSCSIGFDNAGAFPRYELENLSGNISRLRKRLELVPVQQANAARDRTITARYAGKCADCGAELERGQTIRYSKQAGARCETPCQRGEAA